MSWKSINEILGLAIVDPDFCKALLADPLFAAQQEGFALTEEEQKILSEIHEDQLFKLSQQLMTRLAQEVEDR